MTYPDLPDGYYLAEQEGWSHAIFRHVTQYGKSHWRDSIDQRMPDPRTLDYVLTPVSAITAMKADLAEAVSLLKAAKNQFAPHTTNSIADDFIAKHTAQPEEDTQ